MEVFTLCDRYGVVFDTSVPEFKNDGTYV